MIGSSLLAASLLGPWSAASFADDPPSRTRSAAVHPEPIGLPTSDWKPIGPLPERIAPKPPVVNVPKLHPDLPPLPPPLAPDEIPLPDPPVLTRLRPVGKVEYTAMADPVATPPPRRGEADRPACECQAGSCSCCSACSCGGHQAVKNGVLRPQTTVQAPPVYQLADRFGQVWTSPDPAHLQAWVASRNAMQPATVQPPVYYRSTRPGRFRSFGRTCADDSCR